MATKDYDLVMYHLMRSPEVIEYAMNAGLEGEDLRNNRYPHYGLIWESVRDYFVDHATPPPRMLLEREVALRVQQLEIMSPVVDQHIAGLISVAYELAENELVPKYIVDSGMLQALVDEVKVQPLLRQLSEVTDHRLRGQMVEKLTDLYLNSRVVANQQADILSEEGMRKYTTDQEPLPTGIDFIDIVTGGLRPRSLVGLIAESSGGKTMIGTQFVCEQALRGKHVLGLYYEQSIGGDIAERLYSYLSEQSRDVIKGPYDGYADHVKEALAHTREKIGQYLHVYDMSGAVPGQGTGGVLEIEALLNRYRRQGTPIEYVVIDWLQPMARMASNLDKNLKDDKEKFDYIAGQLAGIRDRCRVTILLLHQLAPNEVQGKTPQWKPDWTMAMGCKSLGNMMEYMFTFGRKDEETNCMWFHAPKARGAAKLSRIVRMDAMRNRIYDAHSEFEENSMAARDKIYFMPRDR